MSPSPSASSNISPPPPTTATNAASSSAFLWDGINLGSFSLLLSFVGATITLPFLQSQRDKLGCDALCYGTMQSVRSGLSMVGLILAGRLSDRIGRANVLWIGVFASLFSYVTNLLGGTLTMMWIALIPTSFLNHNFSVMKALFADYCSEYSYSESQRASVMGRLGMMAGVSFMLGPLIGASILSGYEQSVFAAIVFTLASAVLLWYLPTPIITPLSPSTMDMKDQPSANPKSLKEAITSFFYMPAIQSPGARVLMTMRCAMSLAYHIFMTVWTVSLKARFNFSASDHAQFMSWIGLCYALSQSVLARILIKYFREDPTKLLQLCAISLSLGRVAAMMTSSVVLVYLIMAIVVVALGVVNTTMTTDCSRLAKQDQVGGIYGVFEAVEGFAGLIGPTLGGLLHTIHASLPLICVVAAYSLVFYIISVYYHDHVVAAAEDKIDNISKLPNESEKPSEQANASEKPSEGKLKAL
eukprot:gene7273-8048_t